MECLVHHGSAVIGRATLDWDTATSEDPPDDGPTIFGQLAPTAAYAAIRETCRALRQVMHPEFLAEPPAASPAPSPTPSAPSGSYPMESFDSFRHRMQVMDAAKALALRLTRPDGAAIPTVRVVIEDFSPTAAERARLLPQDPVAEVDYLLVAATMPPGATPPR